MSNTVLTTFSYRNDGAARFIDDVAKENYYIFNADHTLPANSSIIDSVGSTINETAIDIYRNMISGKMITSSDVSLAIRNIPYVAGTRYEMYDDKTSNLHLKDYYVCVNSSSYQHVFKCLDNNLDANSTVQPNFSDISGSNTNLYQTSDGYRWKYMYSYSSNAALKFSTNDYIPLVVNTNVQENTTPGSIDIIKLIDPGKGYSNYITGTFNTNDLAVDGDTTMFSIANNVAKTVNGYYTDCILYLTSGVGAGQYRTVSDYKSTGNGNFAQITRAFDVAPTNGTKFEIYPQVRVSGSGNETVNVTARALVNALASNIIYRVEVLNPGRDYIYATANVSSNIAVGVISQAEVRPILSPPGGHGSNSTFELSCRNVIVGATFANSEANTIPSTNFYRKIGLLKNPLFWRTNLSLSTVTGTFIANETVVTGKTQNIKFDVGTISGNNIITTSTGNFYETLVANTPIILRNEESTAFQYVTVAGISNSTSITLNQNVFFTASNASILRLSNTANAVANAQSSSNTLILANTTPKFSPGAQIFGVSSGAHGVIALTARAGVIKDYSTFVQLNKYVGSLTYGVFNQNEYVYQGNSKAYLHSYRLDSGIFTAYTSNQVGFINAGATLTGNVSTAIMSITAKYMPEVVFGTGEPIYIENTTQITRTDKQSEVFKIVLNF